MNINFCGHTIVRLIIRLVQVLPRFDNKHLSEINPEENMPAVDEPKA
jgi:hypothetical protein